MNCSKKYTEIIKKLPLMPENKIHEFFSEFFDCVESSGFDFSDEEVFTLIHDIRVVIFSCMTEMEKNRLCSLITKCINNKGDMLPQLVEYCGLIFKYVSQENQAELFNSIFALHEYICGTNRGIVAFTTFIKYTNKVYNKQQIKLCEAVLTAIEETCDANIKDTIYYTKRNMEKEFVVSSKDVLLLIPEFLSGSSFLQPPLGIMRIKTQLKKLGIESDIFDNRIYNYSLEMLTSIIGNHYKYILVTSTPIDQIQNFFIDHRFVVFAQTCKNLQEKKCCEKLIVVGSHGTVSSEMLLNDVNPDIIIQGEYDIKAAETIYSILNGNVSKLPPQVLYKVKDEWFESEDDEYIDDWHQQPLDFSVVDLEDYFGYRYIGNTHVKQRRWAVLQATRGCPYQCTFCYNLYGHRVRFKDLDVLLQEMKQLKRMSCKELFFIDQTFTLDKSYVKDLCIHMIDENIAIPWQCETRVDLIDENTVMLMKKAGCKAIWLGIESFDENVLKICKKNYNSEQLKYAFSVLNDCQMEYHAFIMVGMEGDSQKSVEHTISRIEREKIKISKSIIQCTPRPGTEYYTHLPYDLRNRITNFWQIDAIRGYSSNGEITDSFVNKMVQRLMRISNES